MNTLPHISHHLFAAALTTEAVASRRPMRAEGRPSTPRGAAAVLPLEVLTAAADNSVQAARPVRTVSVAGT